MRYNITAKKHFILLVIILVVQIAFIVFTRIAYQRAFQDL
jgi:hypothetical protein